MQAVLQQRGGGTSLLFSPPSSAEVTGGLQLHVLQLIHRRSRLKLSSSSVTSVQMFEAGGELSERLPAHTGRASTHNNVTAEDRDRKQGQAASLNVISHLCCRGDERFRTVWVEKPT